MRRLAPFAWGLVVFLVAGLPIARADAQTAPCDERGAPPGDCDADGVGDLRDGCPRTPPGAAILTQGCSALDLALHPDLMVDPILAALDEATAGMQNDETLARLLKKLAKNRAAFDKVKSLLRLGKICQGVKGFHGTERKLDKTNARLGDVFDEAIELAAAGEGTGNGDAGASEVRLAYLQLDRARLDDVIADAAAAGLILDALCASASEKTTRETRIAEIDDAAGLVYLGDGSVHGLAEIRARDAFTAGQDVKIKAVGDVITGIKTLAKVKIDPDLLEPKCFDLLVAPLQPGFAPPSSGPFTLHEIEAYESLGVHFLERGMRLGVRELDCTDPPPGVPLQSFTRYSLGLTLDYTNCNGQKKSKGFGWDIDEDDEPLSLPSCIDGLTAATLTTYQRRQTCQFKTLLAAKSPPGTGIFCGPVEAVRKDEYTILVRPERSYCDALYLDTVFDLEDDDFASFRTARVAVLSLSFFEIDPPFEPFFEAEGYQVDASGQSSHPNTAPVFEDDNFAVYNFDFYDPDGLYQQEIHGVDRASGLRWPRVEGIRNGNEFWYSCALPSIVRDAVDFCPSPPDSFYHYPFAGFQLVGQANNNPDPTSTHCITDVNDNPCYNRYAFDFPGSQGTSILAARGGTVITADESNTGNCYCSSCNPPGCQNCGAPNGNNALLIKHQDGSVGVYFHMPPNGISVTKGQKVNRDDVVAQYGNTGCSTNAHLHFQVDPMVGAAQSIPVRFRGRIAISQCFDSVVPCQIPGFNQPVCSLVP